MRHTIPFGININIMKRKDANIHKHKASAPWNLVIISISVIGANGASLGANISAVISGSSCVLCHSKCRMNPRFVTKIPVFCPTRAGTF